MSTTSDSRQTALLFTDIVDSTGIKARLGTAAYTAVLKRHNTIFETAIHDFAGASIIKHTGDGYLAMFPLAEGAIRCALRLEREIKAEAWTGEPINVRAGVHAGTIAVVHIIDRTDIVGSVADIAARIMSLATGGQILLSAEATEQARPAMADDLVHWKDHGLYKLKGVQDPIEIWEVADTVADFYPSPPGALNMAGDRAKIGPYRILEPLGGGGMGEVYRAEQRSPIRREVAIKLIKLGMDTRLVIARFEAERQALAMMDHPHIAKVFDANTDDTGRPYFVMEYVKGKPITEYADQNHLTIHERLELFEQVCHAIQHAHHKGVIHRDLKPSNVLVSTQDGKPFAKVIDFGIAKAISQRLTEKTLYTQHEQFIGTPQYMSPEQADGQLDIDTRTDVYSLGVLLYELLTGTTPFALDELHAAAMDKIVQMIRDVDPPKPSTRLSSNEKTLPTLAASRRTEPKKLSPLVRGELDWIVMKALEKDRARRYDTPNNLGEDIQRYLSGQPIVAAPPSVGYRARKFVRRYRGPVAAAVVILLTLILGVSATTWQAIRASHARDEAIGLRTREATAKEAAINSAVEANKQRDAANTARDAAEHLVYVTNLRAAAEALEHNELQNAITYLDQCPLSMRQIEWGVLMAKAKPYLIKLDGDSGNVESESYSPDGARILTDYYHGPAKVWDAETGKLLLTLVGGSGAMDATFSADGKRIITATLDGTAQIWDAKTGNRLKNFAGQTDRVWEARFGPDGKQVVTASDDSTVRLWDAESGKQEKVFQLPGIAWHARVSADGKKVFATGAFPDLEEWDIANGTCTKVKIPVPPSPDHAWVTPDHAFDFSPDGKHFAITDNGGLVSLWDTATNKEISQWQVYERNLWTLTSVHFAPDESRILLTRDGGVDLLDITEHTKRTIVRETSFGSTFTSRTGAVLSPDGRHIVAGSGVFGVDTSQHSSLPGQGILVVDDYNIYTGLGTIPAVSPDGKLAAQCPDAHTILILRRQPLDYRRSLLDYRRSLLDHQPPIFVLKSPSKFVCASFSQDDQRLAIAAWVWPSWDNNGELPANADNIVQIWDMRTGRCVESLVGLTGPATYLKFSPDGTEIIGGTKTQAARIWNVNSGKLMRVLDARTQNLSTAAFSKNNAKIVTISFEQVAYLWNYSSGKLQASFHMPTEQVDAPSDYYGDGIAIMPDGKRVLVVYRDTGWFYDSETGDDLVEIRNIWQSTTPAVADGSQILFAGSWGNGIVDSIPPSYRYRQQLLREGKITRADLEADVRAGRLEQWEIDPLPWIHSN